MLAYPSPASSHFSINRSPSTNGQPRPPQQVPSPAPSNYSIPYAYQYSSSHHGGPRWSSNYPQAAPSPSNSSSSSTWTHERPSSYLGSWSASPALTPLMGYGRTSPDQYPTYRAPPTPVSDTGAESVRNDEHDLSTSPSSTTQSRRSSLSKPNEDDGEYIPNTTMPAASNISSGMPRPSKQRKHARPVGLLQCTVCSATSSPEWRKGPSGKKELCNACGLRFARSKTKKINDGQGVVKPSKKKSKLSPALKVMVQEQHMSLSPRLPSHAQGAGSPASSSSHSAQSQSQHQSHNLPPYQDHVASYSPQMINHSPYTNHHQEAYYSAAASLASLSGASGQYFPPYDSGYTGERRERDGKHEFNYEGDGGGADGEAYDGSAEMIQVAR